ncbi:hypothetical protein [Leptospira sp. GIMC2001]|uniref:hypothetical protein n=1 Tax=Leptospira sp. GIMC2001 TaxID=1513297 RepID=UPI00234B55C8|nr:hypothetical protein [Leptospira sp. GIMC2001]WCL50161.1 hypothetical protein O4O04_04905 [Leptospira sp. GIMC2001]
MAKSNSRIEDSRLFFEKKFQIKIDLEAYEKLIFEASKILDNARANSKLMEEIAIKRKAYFFLHRTRRLSLQIDDLKENHGYEKKEFDFIYKLLDKIDENESSDFLDSLLKGSIEKVASSLNPSTQSDAKKFQDLKDKKSFFTFTYRGVNFIAPKKPRKTILNVNPSKGSVVVGNKRYEIHPGKSFGLDPDSDFAEPTHLCILKIDNGSIPYRCFFYHKMDKEIRFDESSVKSRLRSIEDTKSEYIKSYFRYAGVNYYLIET